MNTTGFLSSLVCAPKAIVKGAGVRLGIAWTKWVGAHGDHGIRGRRSSDLYATLLRTNQLIVRERDPQKLLEGICRICVDTGHAHLAIVIVIEGDFVVRACTAGSAQSFVEGMPVRWDMSSPELQTLPTIQAMRTGVHAVSHDYRSDPRTPQYHERAVRSGIRSMAVFPISRGGKVFGALQLFQDELNYFDAALLDLMDELVADMSFALDNIDRDLARASALEQVAAGNDRFRQIFEIAPFATALISCETLRILEVNDAMCKRYALPAEEIVGKHASELNSGTIDAEQRKWFYGTLLSGGNVRNLEVLMRSPEGAILSTLVSGQNIEHLGQRCMLITIVDVTELREAERSREAQAAAEAANRAKTEFISRMSHELRTPLNAVIGFSQLLLTEEQGRLTPLNHSRLTCIQRAGKHLLGLVNDVLDVSSIEAGHISVHPVPVLLEPLLDEAIQTSEPLARQNGVELIAAYGGQPPLGVLADPGRLRQVVTNLMTNAIKYNRAGGSVTLRLSRHGDRVTIDVIDTGMGMTTEQLDHLYEPFNRLGRERGGIEGTGIGLALTRQLVRLMHGELQVASDIGRGTRASVNLGFADVPDSAVTRQHAGNPLTSIAQTHGTVLYIEDNEVNVMLVEQMLAHFSELRFVHAADGQSGLEQAIALQPDLVLLDMQLPDMSGLDVLSRLRADVRTRGLRVVALSASAMPEEVERARSFGADDYWTKPLDFDAFVVGVADVLARRRAAA